jgi:hypothetical protein
MMPDQNPDENSPTGEFPRFEGEPRLEREPKRPKTLPEVSGDNGSTTGVMRVYREGQDETAKRDEDQPA